MTASTRHTGTMRDRVDFPDDDGLRRVLRRFGVEPSGLLGHGGEAWVYAIDDARVVRVLHQGQTCRQVEERRVLVDELASGQVSFALPQVLDCDSIEGRSYAIERRLPGRSVGEELLRLDRRGRSQLIDHHLDAAHALGDLHLDDRPWFGDLLADSPVRAGGWRQYLEAKAASGLARASGFEAIDPAKLATDLPDTAKGSFVHLDAFAGNMLAVGPRISAVIDIGVTSVRGDRRLDPLSAAVYLCAPPITPGADEQDRRVAKAWLANAGLLDLYEPARRWLAAYWAWAADDRELHRWCRAVLLA